MVKDKMITNQDGFKVVYKKARDKWDDKDDVVGFYVLIDDALFEMTPKLNEFGEMINAKFTKKRVVGDKDKFLEKVEAIENL
jgi:hypothetical protein